MDKMVGVVFDLWTIIKIAISGPQNMHHPRLGDVLSWHKDTFHQLCNSLGTTAGTMVTNVGPNHGG